MFDEGVSDHPRHTYFWSNDSDYPTALYAESSVIFARVLIPQNSFLNQWYLKKKFPNQSPPTTGKSSARGYPRYDAAIPCFRSGTNSSHRRRARRCPHLTTPPHQRRHHYNFLPPPSSHARLPKVQQRHNCCNLRHNPRARCHTHRKPTNRTPTLWPSAWSLRRPSAIVHSDLASPREPARSLCRYPLRCLLMIEAQPLCKGKNIHTWISTGNRLLPWIVTVMNMDVFRRITFFWLRSFPGILLRRIDFVWHQKRAYEFLLMHLVCTFCACTSIVLNWWICIHTKNWWICGTCVITKCWLPWDRVHHRVIDFTFTFTFVHGMRSCNFAAHLCVDQVCSPSCILIVYGWII
jgi:hypothetical protein